MNRLLPYAAFSAVAALALSGCGGDSDSGGGTTPPPPPPPPPPALVSYVGSPDVIAAWADPTLLTFDGPDIGSYGGKRQFARGTVDPISGTDLGQQSGVEIYKDSDGHVYAVDLTSSTAPAPVQVSSEAGATIDAGCTFNGTDAGTTATYDYLGVLFSADLAVPTNSTYVYRLPGADGVCNTSDDVVHVVKTNMAATDAPLVGVAMPAAAITSATGALTGFIAKTGNTLVMTDSNVANPVVVGTFGSTVMVADPLPVGLETGVPSGRLFVVDGNIVYVDYAGQTTSAPLFAIPNWTPTDDHIVTAASPTSLYFAVNTPASGGTAASSTIYVMPADGSAAPTVVSVQPGAVRQLEFPVQSDMLYAGVGATSYSIVAIPADQTDGSAGVTIADGITLNAGRFTATATSVYWTMWESDISGNTTTRSSTTSGIVGSDGTVIQAAIPNSQFLLGGEVDPWATGDVTTQREPFTAVFQVSGLTSVTVTDPVTGAVYVADAVSGGSLTSIDTGTNTAIATLGTFPVSTATLLDGTFRGINHTFFIEATTLDSTQDPSTRDLYLVNSHTAGSLTQATDNL